MDEKTLRVLEFGTILETLSSYAVSSVGRQAVLEIKPAEMPEKVEELLAMTEEAYCVKYKYLINPITSFDDCRPAIHKATAGGLVQPGELLKIARLIRAAKTAKNSVMNCGEDIVLLKDIIGFVGIAASLEKDISACIAGENEIRDDASSELRSIRRKITSANLRLKEKLVQYTRSPKTAKYLQDSPVTIRDNRFVLPVRSECRSEIPGIVHDVSGSGSTVFIEPFPIVELNNEIRSLQAAEQEEIEKILRRLSNEVVTYAETLQIAQEQCCMLDIICAKCDYSVSINAICPKINRNSYVRLSQARHPLIDKRKVVPVTMEVGKSFSVLVITGPNTGGKTVCLKTLGLLCLMAYSGIFVPCKEDTELCVFDNIFCDIGDEQSIEQSLSTFSAHITNLVDITNRMTPDSLLLLDELGAGTDPAEGAALAIGVLKYIELMQSRAVVTTHYSEIKEYSLLSSNLMNACMQFDDETLQPTYTLIMGMPGVSNALKISANLGLNDYILKAAYGQLREEKIQFEAVLAHAEKVKTRAEKELSEIEKARREIETDRIAARNLTDKLNKQYESIQDNAKLETAKMVVAAAEQADDILAKMKIALEKSDEAAYLEAKRMRKQLENMRYASESALRPQYTPLQPTEIRIGDTVRVMSLDAEGRVLSLPNRKNEVTVQIGVMPMTVAVGDLADAVKVSQKKSPAKKHISVTVPQSVTTNEVKVLGLTVAEAIEAIEPYLLSGGGSILRIIHGKGTGALGKGIQQYLRTHPHVKSYRYGRYGEGETGVTIVEIK